MKYCSNFDLPKSSIQPSTYIILDSKIQIGISIKISNYCTHVHSSTLPHNGIKIKQILQT